MGSRRVALDLSVSSGTIPGVSRRNREKRAAKLRDRRRAARERPTWAPSDRVLNREILASALRTAASCRCGDSDAHVVDLVRDVGPGGHELDAAADAVVLDLLRSLWDAGWTPIDLHEVGRRRLEPEASGYLDEVIVVESRRYAASTLHPRWRAGLAALDRGVDARRGSHLHEWAVRYAHSRVTSLGMVVRMLGIVGRLPALERLLPLPGSSQHADGPGGEVDAKVLAKVRGLLAKAESTEFPDEADALSAKAQELMTRYALDQALLDHEGGRTPLASGRRLWLDAPYVGAKAHLVHAVATANRCRAVWASELGCVTVVGADTDLDVVELLTTSLLVQANRAMLAAGRQVSRSGTSRTRSYRQSFLIAYATRIGERLQAVSTTATAEAADRLLPVLAARSRATEELTDRLFPHLRHRASAVTNAAGWGAGRAAADLALFDVQGSIAG